MNMTNEQVQVALAAGLALTNPDGDTVVAMKYAAGATILHQLLLAIGSGQVQLQSAEAPTDGRKGPPTSGRKTSRKKAASKKK